MTSKILRCLLSEYRRYLRVWTEQLFVDVGFGAWAIASDGKE